MREQIVMGVVAILGVVFFVQGLVAFNKSEINVIFGRRNKTTVTFTGRIADVLAVISTLAGLVALVATFAFFMGAASFAIVFTAAVVPILVYQMTAFVAKFF